MSNFSWKILHVDVDSRSMVVEYKKDGITKSLNLPMPNQTDDVTVVIHSYAPHDYWEQAKKPLATVFAGMTGSGTSITQATALEDAKDKAKGKINMYRDIVISAGVPFKGYQFDSTEQTINRLTAVITSVQAGVPLPEDFAWRTKTNEMVKLTLTELGELLKAMTQKVTDTFTMSWEKKQQIDNAKTEDEVAAVHWVDLSIGTRV